MTSILGKLKSRADEIASARAEQDRRRAEAQRPTAPAGAQPGVPSVSLDAAYVGTMRPEDVPQDSVSVRTLTPEDGRRREPLTQAQAAGASVAAALARGEGAPAAPNYARVGIGGR